MRPMHSLGIGILAALAMTQVGCQSLAKKKPAIVDWSMVRGVDDFGFDEPGAAWTFRTPPLWRVTAQGDRRFLQMAVPPERPMLPGVRRPQEYAIYNRFEFRSFALACYVRIDRDPSVAGRDVCLLFARQDTTHFYYIHLSNVSDELHNNVVRVDGAVRKGLLPASAPRRLAIVDGNWHRVDVVRDVDAGTIKVYVDLDPGRPNEPPLLEASDRTYEWGFVGLGSFDDHASFGRFAIEGQARPAGTLPPIDHSPMTVSGEP